MKHWYALMTYMKCENSVCEHLDQFNFTHDITTYCPMDRYWSTPRNRKSKKPILVSRPMFSGYVFGHFEDEDHVWSIVRRTRGLSGVIQNNMIPIPVGESLIEEMKQEESEILGSLIGNVEIKVYAIDNRVTVGCMASIVGGQWRGKVLPVVEIKGRSATVRTELLGKECSLNLPLNFLQFHSHPALAHRSANGVAMQGKADALIS